MDVRLEELRELRTTLATHRLRHEMLVTKMQALREHCQEMRLQLAARNRSDAGAFAPVLTNAS